MDYIIQRQEAEEIQKEKAWLMVYGRRKTGKTFLLKRLCQFKNYYTVKRNIDILCGEGNPKTIKEMLAEIKALLEQNKLVVLDEFQRLDESVLEEIVQLHPQGRLILSGSSLKVARKFFASNSPLLGFFVPLKIGLIKPENTLNGLKNFPPEKRIEFATFLREPWLIPLYNQEEICEFIYKIVTKSSQIISALLGEIFSEEERELSKKYQAILALIGAGVWGTKELTNVLYSRNLIPDPSPTHVIQYLKNLEEMALVEKVRLYKSKNKHFYRLYSPIMNIYYYLEDRYNIGSREVSLKEVKPTIEKLINLEIQNFIADLLAEKFASRKEYLISPTKEVDFILTQRNRLVAVGEVKWKSLALEDIKKFKEASADFPGQKILICKQGEKAEGLQVFKAKEVVSGKFLSQTRKFHKII